MKRKTIPAFLIAAMCSSATAASISWDPVIVNTVEANVLTSGTLVTAVNAAGPITVGYLGPVINGITFVSGNPLPNNAAGTFFTAGDGPHTTGSAGLDEMLNSHSYAGSATTFSLSGLAIGTSYVIQIFAVGDTRVCCATRTQIFGDGLGGNSGDLTRFDPASVVGRFVADGITQTISVGPGSVSGVDPGLSGYQLRAVPEPSGLAFLSLSGLALLRRRR